jgi:hypothetical protein
MATAIPELVERWWPGSRLIRLRNSHSYGRVLLLVVVAFVFAACAPDDRWSGSLLLLVEVVTLVVALWTSGVAHADSKLSLGLVAVSTGVAAANLVWSAVALEAATGLFAAVLTVATVAAIAIGIADEQRANARSVLGAISVYVLLGMLFVFIYGAVASLAKGPFFAQGTDGTRSLRLYFSYVTLATLGYGDYTPAGNLGHTLAVAEGLAGQLYLVTVLAVLVSRLGRR